HSFPTRRSSDLAPTARSACIRRPPGEEPNREPRPPRALAPAAAPMRRRRGAPAPGRKARAIARAGVYPAPRRRRGGSDPPLSALERSYDVAGDPAAIEVSPLSLDLLSIHEASLHRLRVEGDVAFHGLVDLCRQGVVPGGRRRRLAVHLDVVVAGE